ncbi:MAG: caspase family protein [Bacteroidetes bacterium]|nr:caspase family protein [Bacteroidota bacterium]
MSLPFDFGNSEPYTGVRPIPVHRRRCANIVVASSGPEEPDLITTNYGKIRSRNGALLKHTQRDAESIFRLWKKQEEPHLPVELQVLLIDPDINQFENAIRNISKKIRDSYQNEIGIDLFFAGHGEQETGNLILKDGKVTPIQFLELQSEDIMSNDETRTIGIFLDSCYSGAFLLHLAIESYENFNGFKFDNGLASCLPDEKCYEMDILQQGVFTYSHLNTGNSYIDKQRFNQNILDGNHEEMIRDLQGMVGMISSPTAFITEGKQFSMSLWKHVIMVEGDFATVEMLDEKTDYDEIMDRITQFKQKKSLSSSWEDPPTDST